MAEPASSLAGRGRDAGDLSACTAGVLLAAICLLAAAPRLGVLVAGPAQNVRRAMLADSPRYVRLAESLGQTGRFELDRPEAPNTIYYPLQRIRAARGEWTPGPYRYPDVLRTPGYPAYLAAAFALGGRVAPLAGQVALSVAVVWLTYALAARMLGLRKLALLAAGLLAIQPGDVVLCNYYASETVFVFLLAGAVVALPGADRAPSRRWSWALLGGALLGVATLVRPVGMVVAPLLGGWLLLRRRPWRRLGPAVLLVGVAALPPLAWAARNASIGYGWTLANAGAVHTAKTAAFIEYHAAGHTRYPEQYMPHYRRFAEEVQRELRDGETVDQAVRRLTLRRIARRPGAYAGMLANSFAKFFLDHSTPRLYHLLGGTYVPTGLRDRLIRGQAAWRELLSAGAIPLAWTGLNALMVLAGLVGLVRMVLRGRSREALLLAGLVGVFLFASQYHGLERMRVPVLWAQCVAASAATFPPARAPGGDYGASAASEG
jgi:4-amino-4-deoxy-L-arabinose transferase-like glycosyltransferase